MRLLHLVVDNSVDLFDAQLLTLKILEMMKSVFLCFFAHTATIEAFYSVNYIASSNHPQVVGQVNFFKIAPDADHVADIYTRLADISPLLREGICFSK